MRACCPLGEMIYVVSIPSGLARAPRCWDWKGRVESKGGREGDLESPRHGSGTGTWILYDVLKDRSSNKATERRNNIIYTWGAPCELPCRVEPLSSSIPWFGTLCMDAMERAVFFCTAACLACCQLGLLVLSSAWRVSLSACGTPVSREGRPSVSNGTMLLL